MCLHVRTIRFWPVKVQADGRVSTPLISWQMAAKAVLMLNPRLTQFQTDLYHSFFIII